MFNQSQGPNLGVNAVYARAACPSASFRPELLIGHCNVYSGRREADVRHVISYAEPS